MSITKQAEVQIRSTDSQKSNQKKVQKKGYLQLPAAIPGDKHSIFIPLFAPLD